MKLIFRIYQITTKQFYRILHEEIFTNVYPKIPNIPTKQKNYSKLKSNLIFPSIFTKPLKNKTSQESTEVSQDCFEDLKNLINLESGCNGWKDKGI